MNTNRLLGIGLILLIISFIFIQPAYVGPGSKTAKTVLSSFWGLMLFIGFTITCLPLSIYRFVCGRREEEQLLKDLH